MSPSNTPPPHQWGGVRTKECRWTETERGDDRSGHVDRGRMGRLPWWHRPQAASRVNGDMKARYCPHAWTARPCGQPGSGPNRGGGACPPPHPRRASDNKAGDEQAHLPGRNPGTSPPRLGSFRRRCPGGGDAAVPVQIHAWFRHTDQRCSEDRVSASWEANGRLTMLTANTKQR